MKELHEVIDGLEDGRWYNIYGVLEDDADEDSSWWAAYWDSSSEQFWTATGDAIFMDDFKVIPEPLPEV